LEYKLHDYMIININDTLHTDKQLKAFSPIPMGPYITTIQLVNIKIVNKSSLI